MTVAKPTGFPLAYTVCTSRIARVMWMLFTNSEEMRLLMAVASVNDDFTRSNDDWTGVRDTLLGNTFLQHGYVRSSRTHPSPHCSRLEMSISSSVS